MYFLSLVQIKVGFLVLLITLCWSDVLQTIVIGRTCLRRWPLAMQPSPVMRSGTLQKTQKQRAAGLPEVEPEMWENHTACLLGTRNFPYFYCPMVVLSLKLSIFDCLFFEMDTFIVSSTVSLVSSTDSTEVDFLCMLCFLCLLVPFETAGWPQTMYWQVSL